MVRPLPVLLTLALTLGACAYKMPTQGGRPINTAFVDSIVKNKTTMEEVRTALGPAPTVSVSGTEQTWTYTHWKGKPALFGQAYSQTSSTLLTVKFKDGKVIDYTLTTSGT